jgi:hypothetical protein
MVLILRAHSYGDARAPLRKVLGPELGARLKPIWGLDPEGEIRSVWRDLGVPRVWCMMGKSFPSLEETATQPQSREFCVVSFPLEARCAACVVPIHVILFRVALMNMT